MDLGRQIPCMVITEYASSLSRQNSRNEIGLLKANKNPQRGNAVVYSEQHNDELDGEYTQS